MPVTWLLLLVPVVCLLGLLAGRSFALFQEQGFRTREQHQYAVPAPAPRFHRVRHSHPQRPVNHERAVNHVGDIGAESFELGLLLEAQGDVVGAENAYRKAAGSGHAGAETILGVLLHEFGERDAAKRHYQRALERGDAVGGFNLGVLLEEEGDDAGASSAYWRADERGHAAAAANLGVLMEQHGHFADARAAYERGDQRGDPKGAFNLGMLMEENGDLDAAHEAYRRAAEYRHRSKRATEGESVDRATGTDA